MHNYWSSIFRIHLPTIGRLRSSLAAALTAVIVCYLFCSSSEAGLVIADRPTCNDWIETPDFTAVLVIPGSIPVIQYSAIVERVNQRVELLQIDACFVNLIDNTIIVAINFESSQIVNTVELQEMLSRKGLIKIIAADQSVLSVGQAHDCPEAVPEGDKFPRCELLATNDDIVGATVVLVTQDSYGVAIVFESQVADRISQHSIEHVGEQLAVTSDGQVISVSTIKSPFLPASSKILLAEFSYVNALLLAFHLSSDAYPAALCVLEIEEGRIPEGELNEFCGPS